MSIETGFEVSIKFHNDDAEKFLKIDKVGILIAAALEETGAKEDIDFTVEISRTRSGEGPNRQTYSQFAVIVATADGPITLHFADAQEATERMGAANLETLNRWVRQLKQMGKS